MRRAKRGTAASTSGWKPPLHAGSRQATGAPRVIRSAPGDFVFCSAFRPDVAAAASWFPVGPSESFQIPADNVLHLRSLILRRTFECCLRDPHSRFESSRGCERAPGYPEIPSTATSPSYTPRRRGRQRLPGRDAPRLDWWPAPTPDHCTAIPRVDPWRWLAQRAPRADHVEQPNNRRRRPARNGHRCVHITPRTCVLGCRTATDYG
jgi:hypothetical protein